MDSFKESVRDKLAVRAPQFAIVECPTCKAKKWHGDFNIIGLPVFAGNPFESQEITGYLPVHSIICTECGYVKFFVTDEALVMAKENAKFD